MILILLGIGVNGHLGFNEPGTSFNSLAHLVQLTPVTRQTGKKYFSIEKNLDYGVTIGMRQIMEAKTAVLVAGGGAKLPALKKLLDGEVTEELPASTLKLHRNCFLFLDRGGFPENFFNYNK